MKQFMDKDFLLTNEVAKELFFDAANTMPIVDYHCHIDPKEIAEDRKFENITQVWLGGDHYKWRQMRSNGVDEYYITGDAPDREKFQKRGEVGAGVIFIAIGYNLGGPALLISVLTIVLNLILTGGFVMLVKKLALKTYTPDAD